MRQDSRLKARQCPFAMRDDLASTDRNGQTSYTQNLTSSPISSPMKADVCLSGDALLIEQDLFQRCHAQASPGD